MDARIIDHHRGHWYQLLEVFPTLTAFMGTGGGNVPLVVYRSDEEKQTAIISLEGTGSRPSHNGSGYSENGKMYTLNTIEKHAVCYVAMDRKHILRQLTPLECCRLQGFPDWWMDGVKGSDADKYKMWGNGIALPCAADVLGRLAEELNREDSEK